MATLLILQRRKGQIKIPITEKSVMMRCSDKNGNKYIILPITTAENIDGLDELIEEAKILNMAISATVSGITELMVGFSFIMVPNTISTSQSTVRKIIQLHGKLRNKK